jgi:hypothetical protein
MLDDIAEQLSQLDVPGGSGSFVTRRSVPAADLSIEVRGAGELRLPVSASQAEALRRVARPAPFGWRDQTLQDRSVRDTWEVAANLVKIAARGWKATLAAALDEIRRDLGLPDGCVLEPVLDKLLLYERGQFFRAHQDSERDDAMVGTLLVVLPSRYTGGTLRVEHQGESRSLPRLKSQATDLSLIAFYADCRHEVTPVKSGHRVVLSYQLHLAESTDVALPAVRPGAVEALAARVRAYFETPIDERWSRGVPRPPERLVYLLDHEYSERSLSWGRLKGADRVRVGALCQVAEHLDCECHLTLADVSATWDCYPEFERRGSWPYGHREVEEVGHVLGDLIDDNVELHHWLGRDGRVETHAKAPVHANELCFTRSSKDMDPFESRYEGYQGNYGNTEERWYHRAALVMWPRDKAFVVHAKASPAWAVGTLAALPRSASAELEAKVRSLVPSWDSHALRDQKPKFFAELMKVAERLEDPDLTADFVRPVGVERLGTAAVRRALARLVATHGEPWGKTLFGVWTERERWRGPPEWLPWFADTCEELCAGDEPAAPGLAAWLLDRETARAHERCIAACGRRSTWLDLAAFAREAGDLALVLAAAARLGDDELVAHEARALTAQQPEFPLLLRLAVLRDGIAQSAELRQLLVASELYRGVVDELRGLLARPAREPNDWSIDHALGCSCGDCAELGRFLRASQQELDWPLSTERRRHVHGVLDALRLPVSHATRRQGRPFVLELRKRQSLFDREAEYHESLRTALGELEVAGAAR